MKEIHIHTVLDLVKQDLHLHLIQSWELKTKDIEEIFIKIKEEIKGRNINI